VVITAQTHAPPPQIFFEEWFFRSLKGRFCLVNHSPQGRMREQIARFTVLRQRCEPVGRCRIDVNVRLARFAFSKKRQNRF
ncbi:hypothetical protein, partial [Pseudomonas viridiflava]|uniref:hypothetical protein n=1 Tax=Pseudomonas viridiflava TaxID=33069 RepID=UPI0019CFF6D8